MAKLTINEARDKYIAGLTPEQRSAKARHAANARYAKKKKVV